MRIYQARRKVLTRQIVTVESTYGPVNVKVAWLDGKVMNVSPEYEDCRRIAEEKEVPLKQVLVAAQAASLLAQPAAIGGTYENPAPVSEVPEFVQSTDAPESSNLIPEPVEGEAEETGSAEAESAPGEAAREPETERSSTPAARASRDEEPADQSAPAKTSDE